MSITDAGILRLLITANSAGLTKALHTADAQVAGFSKIGALNLTKFKVAATMGFAAIAIGSVYAISSLTKLGKKFEEAQFIIRRGTGATGKALDELTESMKRVYATVSQGSADTAKAIEQLNTATDLTGVSLERLAKQELDLARISDGDLTAQIAATTQLFHNWSIATDKQSTTLDWLWKVSAETGIGVTDLAQRVVQVGAPLRALGFDFETATALMGKFEKEGVSTRTILSSLKIGLARMAREGFTDATEGLRELIKRIKEAPKEVDAIGLALDIFGSRAAADFALAVREGRFEVDDLLKSLRESPETIEAASEATKSLGEKWSETVHKIEVAFAPLAGRVLDSLTKTFDAVAEAVEKKDWGAIGLAIGEMVASGIKAAAPVLGEALWEATKEGLKNMPRELAELGAETRDTLLAQTYVEQIRRIAERDGISIATAYAQAMEQGFRQVGGLAPKSVAFQRLSDEQMYLIAQTLGFTEEQIAYAAEHAIDGLDFARILDELSEKVSAAMPSLMVPGRFGIAGMDWAGIAEGLKKIEPPALEAAKAVDYTAESVSKLSAAYAKTSTVDAWTAAVESSAKAADKTVEAYDASKTSLTQYIDQLQKQYDAIANQQKNLAGIMEKLGESGGLSFFAAEGWDAGAVQNILIEKAGELGPEVLEALIGADPATVQKVIQQWMNLIWQESEGQKTELVESNKALGEAAAQGYNEGLASGWAKYATDWSKETGYTPVSMGGTVYGKAAGEQSGEEAGASYAGAFEAKTAALPTTVEKQLAEIDARPAGLGIGADLVTGIQRQLARWKPATITIPVQFSLSPFEGEAGGGGGSRASMLDYADNFVGKVPYVWGGATPRGWDCSGYVGYVLSHFGISHPRTAAGMQAYFPKGGSPTPGDLLFYGTPASHVSMYYGHGLELEAAGGTTRFDQVGKYSSVGRVPMYDAGGWVLPPAQRSTGQEVPAILHAGEYVLTQNQAAAMFGASSFAAGGLVGWQSAEQRTQFLAFNVAIEGIYRELKKSNEDQAAFLAAFLAKLDARAAVYESYGSRESARYTMQQAEFAPGGFDTSELSAMTSTLTKQIELLDKAVAEAMAQLNEAKYLKLPQDEINKLATNLFNLRARAADTRQELESLARVPLEQAAARWSSAVSQTNTMMDLLGNSSNALALQTQLLPTLMGQMGAGYQSALDLMNAATSPADIMGYATSAISSLSSMFGASQSVINRGLSDTLASIDSSQSDWEAAWSARASILEASINRQREALQDQLTNLDRAHREELDSLSRFYDDKLRLLDDSERQITRAQQRNAAERSVATLEDELRILRGQEGYTAADIARMRDLETQIQERHDDMANQDAAWAREDERTRLQREKEEAVNSLQQQQEMERIALEDQVKAAQAALEAQRQAFEEQRIAQQQAFDRQREQARAAAQAEIDALVLKYQRMMQEVIDRQNELLAQAGNYQNAGYTLGQQFAQGLIDALPLIRAAAQAAAQTAANYLQLASPAKLGPLHDLEEWLKPLPEMLVKPLSWGRLGRAAMDTAGQIAQISQRQDRIDIWLHAADQATAAGMDLDTLAEKLTVKLEQKARVRAYDF